MNRVFAQLHLQMQEKLAGNPFSPISEALIKSIQLQWGWGILFVGAILIIITPFIKGEGESKRPHFIKEEESFLRTTHSIQGVSPQTKSFESRDIEKELAEIYLDTLDDLRTGKITEEQFLGISQRIREYREKRVD